MCVGVCKFINRMGLIFGLAKIVNPMLWVRQQLAATGSAAVFSAAIRGLLLRTTFFYEEDKY